MQNFILLILVLILLESSFLVYRNIKNNKSNSRGSRRRIFIDTSVLIDGRILAIAETGFLSGLDIVNQIERVVNADVQIYHDDISGKVKVDDRLISLAKEQNGMILTCDFNLIKVANAEGVETLNINDLVLSLRSEHQPGEKISIKIISEGSNKNQGVGYLKDGTMVVVDNAKRNIGKQIDVILVRTIQTSAGHMLFAEKYTKRK